MKKKPTKQRVSTLVALTLLVGAAVVGVVALLNRSDEGAAGTPAASSTTSAGATPGATASAGAEGKPVDPADRLVVPKGVVNPLRGKDYCQTAKLLAIYSRQRVGLNKDLTLSRDGRAVDQRLRTIAAAFRRLADQVEDRPAAGDVAASWTRIADATTKVDETLRIVGYVTYADAMLIELATYNETFGVEVTRATAKLKDVCGFSGAIFLPQGG